MQSVRTQCGGTTVVSISVAYLFRVAEPDRLMAASPLPIGFPQILVLERGRIVEHDCHDELLAKGDSTGLCRFMDETHADVSERMR